MSDAELIADLRGKGFGVMEKAADRIEALTKERDDYAFKLADANNTYSEMHVELEALTEQLEAARADAKEAETYAEDLERNQVDLCRQLIAAEDKLAKAMEVITAADKMMAAFYSNGNITDRHLKACSAGVDYEKSRTTLAELGETKWD